MKSDNNTQLQPQNAITKRSVAGFSLIELMIAMGIGLVILAAVVQIFVRSNATSKLDEGLSRVQEGARFAMDYLAKDIRMAGYLGCSSSLFAEGKVNNIVKPTADLSTKFSPGGMLAFRYNCTTGCSGGLAEWDPDLSSDFFANGEVQVGSDVIIIQRGSDLDTTLDGTLPPDNANIKIKDTAAIAGQIQDDDVLLISDCTNADVFRATNVNNTTNSGLLTITHDASGNTGPKLSKSYGVDARLMKLVTNAYYVKLSDTTGEPGLFRKELGTAGLLTAQELVGGVESMKILYGLDTAATGSASQYVVPGGVLDWTKVVSVRLGFIARTPGSVDSEQDTNSYDLLDDAVSPLDDFDPVDDNRRRRVFNTTIRVRNH